MKSAELVIAMSVVTIMIRFLPFITFRKKVPKYISYLGRVLPSAIIGMLVVYCLKGTTLTAFPYGIPEIIATICVIAVQAFKRNAILSILSGTVLYMILTFICGTII